MGFSDIDDIDCSKSDCPCPFCRYERGEEGAIYMTVTNKKPLEKNPLEKKPLEKEKEKEIEKEKEEEKEEEKYGHPRFYELLKEFADLYSRKNHDYAVGGDPLGSFKRRAMIYSMYPGLDLSDPTVVALVGTMKQLDAALWLLSNKHDAIVEGVNERLKDVAIYASIGMILEEEKKNRKEE